MKEYHTINIAGRDVPEFIVTENGVRFTEKWLRECDEKRCILPESILRCMAAEIAESIVVRTYENGNSHDTRRQTTEKERDILYGLAYSALLGLNHSEESRQSKTAEDAIINSFEYACIVMLPDANCYDSMYIPLRKMVANWRNHTQAEINLHYGNP